jgi:hypothetical protein
MATQEFASALIFAGAMFGALRLIGWLVFDRDKE